MKKKKLTFGQKLVQAAREAVAIARGEADPATYRVYYVESGRVIRRGRVLSNGCGR